MQELPFQEGKPLSPITKEGDGSIELLEYSHTADSSPDHQVYMASLCNADDDEKSPEFDDEQLVDVSTNEPMADAPPQDENEEHRRVRRLKNSNRAQRRRKRRKSCLQSNVPKESQQHFCSSRGSGVS
jgi:hypothetical protein